MNEFESAIYKKISNIKSAAFTILEYGTNLDEGTKTTLYRQIEDAKYIMNMLEKC